MLPVLARSDRLLRLAAPAAVALGLCAFAAVLWSMAPSPMSPLAVLVIVANAYAVSELCRWVYRRSEHRVWKGAYGRRLAIQLGLGSAVAVGYALLVYVPVKLLLIARGEQDAIGPLHLGLIALSALGVALSLGLSQFALRFFHDWQASHREAEHQRREALRGELDAMRAQVNPHFLFNSLGLLYGLIAEDPPRAQALMLKLAELFRYASRHAGTERVTLADELAFVTAYAELLQARHGAALVVDIAHGSDDHQHWLPPLVLQTLVENAIKHNALDPAAPLRVAIRRDGADLLVCNPRRPRLTVQPASGTGLSGIRRRYALLSQHDVDVQDGSEAFTVRLPLLGPPPA